MKLANFVTILMLNFIMIMVNQVLSSAAFSWESKFYTPKTRLSVILVKTKSKAEEVMNKLQKGEDFARLAQQYSNGPSASTGGDVGYFSKGDLMSLSGMVEIPRLQAKKRL